MSEQFYPKSQPENPKHESTQETEEQRITQMLLMIGNEAAVTQAQATELLTDLQTEIRQHNKQFAPNFDIENEVLMNTLAKTTLWVDGQEYKINIKKDIISNRIELMGSPIDIIPMI